MSEKPFFAGNIIKAIVFLVLAVGAVLGNFFLEQGFSQAIEEDKEKNVEFTFDYKKENQLDDNIVIRFDENFSNKLQGKSLAKGNIFELKEGHFWGNFSMANVNSNIFVGRVVIMPVGAVFDLKYENGLLDLAVYDGDVYIGFLPKKFSKQEFFDPYSGTFLNSLLVPRDNKVSVASKKITNEIQPLLYLKLLKEFKYSSIGLSDNLKDADFVFENRKKDQEFSEKLKQNFKTDFFALGNSVVEENKFSDFLLWAQKNLTFIPQKRNEIFLNDLFSSLDIAIYSAFSGDTEKANVKKYLDIFDAKFSLLSEEVLQNSSFQERFESYIDDLIVFGPGDDLYLIREFLLNKKSVQQGASDLIVSSYWQDVYRALNVNDFAAEEALDKYYNVFDKTLGKKSDEDFYRMYITYQNQLFDNLLIRFPIFYKDGYFAMKDVFENELITLYANSDLEIELKQDFISKKIDFLRRLKKFFFEEKIDVIEAKKIYSRLFSEVNELMPDKSSATAVLKLFEAELADFDDFWGYLTNLEYHKNAYGPNHAERYKIYLSERDTILNFIKVQEDVLGTKISEEISVVDVVEEIEDVLISQEDLGELEIGEIKDVDQRNVDIKAVLGGYPFKAVFDRDTGLLSEVYAYEELITQRPLKLGNLLAILQEKFADLAETESPNEDEDYTIETDAQRTARVYIIKKIAEYGFSADIKNVSVVDQLNAIYKVESATLEGLADVEISFDIVMNGEIATNLFIKMKDKPQLINGKFTLEELAEAVKIGINIGTEKEDKKGKIAR